ncbi:head completion/stabilization protein [Mannheimia sp. E30BD]|uniref:head completion/stabilization protein n=1 Tax=Mannheimia sp. E30BD TaxID=3278708 RepID=UPI00359CBC30
MLNGRKTEYSEEVIVSDGFWGNISISEFQKQRAIPLQIPLELIKTALIGAMQSLEIDLAELVSQYRTGGIHYASEIKGTVINGETAAQALYKKALFARAKHDLLPEFATMSARDLHEKRDIVEEQKQLLTESVHAIRTLKNKRRGSVWII